MSMFTSSNKFLNSALAGASPQPVDDLDVYAVTPADGSDLPSGQIGGSGTATRPTTYISVTGAGNVNVQLFGGGTAVLTGLSAGQRLQIAVTRILSTSTTATGIYAEY